jgi:hypothetical protein
MYKTMEVSPGQDSPTLFYVGKEHLVKVDL